MCLTRPSPPSWAPCRELEARKKSKQQQEHIDKLEDRVARLSQEAGSRTGSARKSSVTEDATELATLRAQCAQLEMEKARALPVCPHFYARCAFAPTARLPRCALALAAYLPRCPFAHALARCPIAHLAPARPLPCPNPSCRVPNPSCRVTDLPC